MSAPTDTPILPVWRAWGPVALVAALVVGAGLRLVWGHDIEYKSDEAWTYYMVRSIGKTEPFPWLGMPTSLKARNPGMSVWVFVALGKLFPVNDPPALARAVQLCNLAALAVFAFFAWRVVPPHEREPWLWSVALLALHPMAVLFHRKIWPPSVLPLFVSVFLIAWWYRDRRAGAFVFGLLAACMGQIHLGAFFFAAGFIVWAFLFDRRRVAWLSWLVGGVTGALSMLPWLWYLLHQTGSEVAAKSRWGHLLEGKFWTRWVTESAGLGLDYALDEDFSDFLRYPLVHGRATYLVAALHASVAMLGVVLLVRWCLVCRQNRVRLADALVGRGSQTAFTLCAALWGCGLCLTLSRLPIHRHYMIILYPFELLWLARLALLPELPAVHRRLGRSLLAAACAAQLLISASFLGYVHVNHGVAHGEYGIAYSGQPGATDLSP